LALKAFLVSQAKLGAFVFSVLGFRNPIFGTCSRGRRSGVTGRWGKGEDLKPAKLIRHITVTSQSGKVKKVIFWISFLILNKNYERQSDVMVNNKLAGNVNNIFKRITTVNALAH